MKIIRVLGILVMIVVWGGACAYVYAAQLASSDVFIQKTAAGNKFEIDTSRMALEKTSNDKIRSFAREMIADHTKAGKDFKNAVAKAGMDNPAPDDTPDAHQKSVMDSLRQASGGDFDRKYIDAQVEAHNDTTALFADYVENGSNGDLKSFSRILLPTLKHHQDMAKSLQQSE